MAGTLPPELEPYADNVAQAEQIIGYEFEDKELVCAALTHPSAMDRLKLAHDYERLEFLGDSILGAVVAVHLFDTYEDLDEGGLTRIKVALVAGESLAYVASDVGLADCIIFGDSEVGTSGRGLKSALENVYESLVAALFLDGGIEVTRAWIEKSLIVYADRDMAFEPESPKSLLQEILQDKGKQPEYQITRTDGPPHDRTFFAQALCDGKVLGEGSGSSKKRAEAAAAAEAVKALEQ